MTLPARMVADLIGKPYAERGRGPCAYDCEGLFLEVQRRLGYKGPAPGPSRAEDRARAWMHVAQASWRLCHAPEPSCAVFFAGDLHVGTMIDAQRFLHTSEELGHAHIDALDSPRWKAKKPVFYAMPRPVAP